MDLPANYEVPSVPPLDGGEYDYAYASANPSKPSAKESNNGASYVNSSVIALRSAPPAHPEMNDEIEKSNIFSMNGKFPTETETTLYEKVTD